jgi:excisionase family DNA binding protein
LKFKSSVYLWAQCIIGPLNPIDIMFKERTILQIDADELLVSIEEMFNKKVDEMMEKMESKELIYTRDEAAKLLHSSPNTISSLVRQGILKNRGFGRKVLISSRDLERAVKNKTVKIKI